MSTLTEFKAELETIDAIDDLSIITIDGTPTLQVKWFGEPANYQSTIKDIRNEHPEITQCIAPDDYPKQTSDKMPISYYRHGEST